MPIKWNALEVSEAMDEVEELVSKADPFLADAEARVRKATGIAKLPQYIDQRLHRLIFTIQGRQNIKNSITGVRESIPDGALEADRRAKRQPSLGLDTAPCGVVQRNHFAEWLAQEMNKEE